MQLAQCETAGAPGAPLIRQDYRDAMARLAAAVNIITTDGPSGRAGFTATAVCSVTDEPPTLLVCLNRSASAHPIVTANGQLCVNTLAGAQRDLSNLFGGKTPMAERFAAAQWSTGVTGSPLLDGATVSFDCRISHSASVGTHDILYCEVLAVYRRDSSDALVYFGRNSTGCPAPAERSAPITTRARRREPRRGLFLACETTHLPVRRSTRKQRLHHERNCYVITPTLFPTCASR